MKTEIGDSLRKDIQRIVDYCHGYAEKDLENIENTPVIPFGVVIENDGKLCVVVNHKDLPESDRLSHKNVVETLTYHFDIRLKEKEIISYGITYYAKAQINDEGDQSDAFVIDIIHEDSGDLPLYIFPYSWSEQRELIFGKYYRMKKKR